VPKAAYTLPSEQIMKKLKNGWVEGSIEDFLDLSDADLEYIELRRTLSRLLREKRQRLRLTQVEVAARLRTSQSRVAKMEKADASVSSDLLLQSLFRLGLKRKELAGAI
jgi:DNA-binding transcriptional regulator YiaG